MFPGFANFYHYFIQSFNKIAGLLTLILKTNNLSENSVNKIVEDDEVIRESNNSGRNLAKSKKSKNHRILVKSKKSSYSKSSKSKKAILDKFEILVNLTVATNADVIRYFTPKARKSFT